MNWPVTISAVSGAGLLAAIWYCIKGSFAVDSDFEQAKKERDA